MLPLKTALITPSNAVPLSFEYCRRHRAPAACDVFSDHQLLYVLPTPANPIPLHYEIWKYCQSTSRVQA